MAETDNTAAKPAQEAPPEEKSPAKAGEKKPYALIVLAVLLVVGAFFGYRAYSFGKVHASTDDAYVTNDVVPINPRVAGNIAKILVEENRHVNAGDLLVTLDDATYLTDLHQAEADLAVAQTAVRGAHDNVVLSKASGAAQITEAQGGITQSQSDIQSAVVGVAKANTDVASARAALSAVQANAAAALAVVRTQQSAVTRSSDQANAVAAALDAAEAAERSARANLAAAEATAANAEREAKRNRTLANQGAISDSVADQRETTAATARAQVDAARQALGSATANAAQQRANLAAARQAIREAQNTVRQGQAQAKAAEDNVVAGRAKVAESLTGVDAAQQAVAGARARETQAVGKLDEAKTAPAKVSIDRASQHTSEARIKQALAEVERARINLARTRIYAPVSGIVSHKTLELGQQVTVGQPVMSIVPDQLPWVVANFKETQLDGMKPGLPVDVEADAVPGHVFHGRVDSISRGTGATFALLPADNATGNFTKVVQRVPVKIVFEKQPDLDLLHAGMSVGVVVSLKP
jgi:membrane fusion protein (multidrug efflux system)